jgi:hypothetical protein
VSQDTSNDWQAVGSGKLGNAAEFFEDGRFTIFGMTFDQHVGITNVRLNDADVEKAAGYGQVLRIDTPDATYYLKYDAFWYYKTEPKKAIP